MSVNVLYRVLPRALYAAGLLVSKADGVYKTELYDLSKFHKRLLPDALHEAAVGRQASEGVRRRAVKGRLPCRGRQADDVPSGDDSLRT